MFLKLKLTTLLALTVLPLISTVAKAQVTDADLKKYIVVIDSIETLTNQFTDKMNKLATGNGKISASRFNSLMPVVDNPVKLTELKATPEEIAYVKKAAAIQNEDTRNFQRLYQSLVNDYMGDGAFTKVRNGLKTDTALKKKYDSLTVKPVRP